jgi:beta-lactam-binding protein with PASTA domain
LRLFQAGVRLQYSSKDVYRQRFVKALTKLGIVLGIVAAFIFSMAGTVYLSLRTSEVKVPEVTNKTRSSAEKILEEAGLHMRVRASRYSKDVDPETVLDQSPVANKVVKAGQTVAVVVSRATVKEGEGVSSEPQGQPTKPPAEAEEKKAEDVDKKEKVASSPGQKVSPSPSEKKKKKDPTLEKNPYFRSVTPAIESRPTPERKRSE